MKKKLLLIISAIILFVTVCTITIIIINQFKNPQVSDFKSCFDAGYPVMESYPLKCFDGENTYVEDIIEDKDSVICPLQYDPVCAIVEVQCITVPCEPIYKTFQNRCFAKGNEIVHYGACSDEEINNS